MQHFTKLKHYQLIKNATADNLNNSRLLDLRKNSDGDLQSNAIFTLDIEVTSLLINKKTMHAYTEKQLQKAFPKIEKKDVEDNYTKAGYCYIWMFGINDIVYYGRTLEEYNKFITNLTNYFKMQIIVYVHNLAYEFQYLRYLHRWQEDTFAMRENRKIMRCTTLDGSITYKCSYILSNLKLSKLAEYYNLPVTKLDGDLDYSLARHSLSELNLKEFGYCKHDILVLYHYIKYEKEKAGGNLRNIPMTSTGKIRKIIQKSFGNFWEQKNNKRNVARNAPDVDTFKALVRAYMGGYTHANYMLGGLILEDMKSMDLISSYPAAMVLEKYPIGKFYKVNLNNFSYKDIIKTYERYAYLLTIKFYNVTCATNNTFISFSKAYNINGNYELDNGRIKSAEEFTLTITEMDFLTIYESYKIQYIEFIEVKRCVKKYLPINIIECIDDLFKIKNDYKMQLEVDEDNPLLNSKYNQTKSLINSIYGMIVTNYISDVITLKENGDIDIEFLTDEMVEQQLQELKDNNTLFIQYQVGVWVTAYARRNLLKNVIKFDQNVAYCDTDSMKMLNFDQCENEIIKFNDYQTSKLNKMRDFYKKDFKNLTNIGHWDFDGDYKKFITLGAKKYCVLEEKVDKDTGELYDKIKITVAGVPKKTGSECIKNIEDFKIGFVFKGKDTKKNTIYYNDEKETFTLTDESGITEKCTSLSSNFITTADYKLGVSKEYFKLIRHNMPLNLL